MWWHCRSAILATCGKLAAPSSEWVQGCSATVAAPSLGQDCSATVAAPSLEQDCSAVSGTKQTCRHPCSVWLKHRPSRTIVAPSLRRDFVSCNAHVAAPVDRRQQPSNGAVLVARSVFGFCTVTGDATRRKVALQLCSHSPGYKPVMAEFMELEVHCCVTHQL